MPPSSSSTIKDTDNKADSQADSSLLARALLQVWQTSTQYPRVVAAVILLVSMTLFLTLNVNGHWDFALPLRGKKLLALMVVGYAIGVSTGDAPEIRAFLKVAFNRFIT